MLLQPIPNKVRIRSFWITTGLLGGGFTFVLLGSFAGIPDTARMSAALAVTAASFMLMFTPMHVAEKPYRAWNYGVRKFSKLATRYVTTVCFLTIVRPRVCPPPERPSEFEPPCGHDTMWKPRDSQAATGFACQWSAAGSEGTQRRDTALRSWLRHAAPDFAWSLIPFILLMRFLDAGDSRGGSVSSHVYTLY